MGDTIEALASYIRFVSDDREGNWSELAEMLPPINAGWREFQRRMILKGSPIFKKTVEIDIPAVTGTRLDSTTTPALPADFMFPYFIEEKVTGTSDEWIETRERQVPAGVIQTLYLNSWSWQDNGINFLGATRPITIRLLYGKSLPSFEAEDDEIPIPLAVDAIAWCVLYDVALAKGATDSYRDRCSKMADECIETLGSLHVKREQWMTQRRRAHSAGRF